MTTGVSSIGSVNTGTCPHGLSPGACPVCSSMGSNLNKVKTADFTAKPGEMSWNECAAIGAFLKSLQNARLARDADFQQRLFSMAKFQNDMTKAIEGLNQFIQTMSKNTFTKPLAFIAQKMVLPVVEAFKNLPVAILTNLAKISEKFNDISDKLAAVFGELKAATDKKISDLVKRVKKRLFSIFEIFSANNESDDNEIMIAFEKQLNKLKNMLEKISERIKKEELEYEN